MSKNLSYDPISIDFNCTTRMFIEYLYSNYKLPFRFMCCI